MITKLNIEQIKRLKKAVDKLPKPAAVSPPDPEIIKEYLGIETEEM